MVKELLNRGIKKHYVILLSIALSLIVYFMDILTRARFGFSIFYIPSILIATWYAGRWYGLGASLAATLLWFIADLASGLPYLHPLVPYWNAGIRMGFYTMIVLLLSALKSEYEQRERLIKELRTAMENLRVLRGLLPICAWCKKIRDDSGYWKQLEQYVEEHSEAAFTHGICPECMARVEKEES